MELSSILKPEAVKVFGTLTSKKRLFQDLGEIAASCYGLPASDVVDALQERESLGPTGVGQGVALPHARLEGLDHVVGAFLRLDKPMDFDSVDRQPVDLIFALFAPKDSGVDHLKALALVSRTLRDTTVCAKLRANDDPVTLHALLTEAPSSTKAA
ncbi:PTS sugar transporter subunit IIA [Actibacterium sp. XHP0104]|uniref:PTS sugar transporter subunit IIA n=1 Tax=Actibacterium sp. XHP0104 TaxID=2984335 RepID=UPI0021E95F05|nr:PTS sugar transporter subunit IIA [Actibacterium sp. XHP0104]MCV2882042.1 PTS sugar transporter subunit IIA [Actibacterium sp. XHP0104]